MLIRCFWGTVFEVHGDKAGDQDREIENAKGRLEDRRYPRKRTNRRYIAVAQRIEGGIAVVEELRHLFCEGGGTQVCEGPGKHPLNEQIEQSKNMRQHHVNTYGPGDTVYCHRAE